MTPLFPKRLLEHATHNKALDEEDQATFMDHCEKYQKTVASVARIAINKNHHEFLSSVVDIMDFWCEELIVQLSVKELSRLFKHYPVQAGEMYQFNDFLMAGGSLTIKMLQLIDSNPEVFQYNTENWETMLHAFSHGGKPEGLQWVIANHPEALNNKKMVLDSCMVGIMFGHPEVMEILLPYGPPPSALMEKLHKALPPGGLPYKQRQQYFQRLQPYVDQEELTAALADVPAQSAPSRSSKM